MTTTGTIKEINNNKISVEMLNKGSSCRTGNCISCSSGRKKRLIETVNTKKLPIKIGSIIEMEISSTKVILATFRVLIFPLLLFIVGFIAAGNIKDAGEGLQVVVGFLGLGGGFLFNFLLSRKIRIKEIPEIVRIL